MHFLEAYRAWLASDMLTDSEREELMGISADEGEIESRFYGPLSFGTAGLRGILGVGLNRMNVHVIRHATQAFAEVIAEAFPPGRRTVAICYDCRNFSREFAEQAAMVLAGNGIQALLFDGMRPTPELSFAVRRLGCSAGINITASHNPREYNGYKVYWSDGAQLPPEQAAAVAERMARIDIFTGVRLLDFEKARTQGLIELIGKAVDDEFLENVMAMATGYEAVAEVAEDFSMVYTPFHGTGREMVPEVLSRLGVKRLYCVPEQMVADGNFPTVQSPNPEDFESFALAITLAKEKNASFILGTDPDTDRVGILSRNAEGAYTLLTGNQTGVLLLDYLIGVWQRTGRLPERPVVLKTIVTTEMARTVAEENGLRCMDTFTGFKFMAEKKNALEAAGEGHVVFAYEESFGYMIGDYVRDKDAVTASLLLTEMAAWYWGRGLSLLDALDALYEKYGFYMEKTLNLVMPGLDGISRMQALMQSLRDTPPERIGGVPVVSLTDFATGQRWDCRTGAAQDVPLRGSNVLRFDLADENVILIRPSGTEPKVKVYVLVTGSDKTSCEGDVSRYSDWAKRLGEFDPAPAQ